MLARSFNQRRPSPVANQLTTVVGSYPQPEWLVDRAMLSKVVPRTRLHAMWRLPAEQRALWGSVSRVLRSRAMQDAFKLKFRQSLETRFGRSIDQIDLYPIPILVCDLPGYQIGIHADVMAKAITVQFYLPKDASQRHIGTVFHYGRTGPEAERTIAMDFMPASGYAFAVMERESWHSARRTTEADGERWTLMLTYYVQDTPKAWFKRRWDRFRSFFGMGPKG